MAALAGVLAGVSSSVFLYLLEWATQARELHPGLILLLPLGGLAIGTLYHCWGDGVHRGHNLILDEIHDPKTTLPLRMAPLVLLGTIVTHLLGGSAGREGTAVQLGASLSDQLSRLFGIENGQRKILLIAGAGAGFGAAIGAPFAGALFGMEVIYVSGLRLFAVLECFVASYAGYFTSIALHAAHSRFPANIRPEFDLKTLAAVAISGICFGLSALIFVKLVHWIEGVYRHFAVHPVLRPFFGGIVLIILYRLLGTDRYAGLGIPVIQSALLQPASFIDPILKGIMTALTVGSGFKGGEFVPLVFIGTTLGSALASVLPASATLLGGLGFAAVFAGAANTPIACTAMAIEIFGLGIGPYALVACWVSYLCSGHQGIYRSQKLEKSKYEHLRSVASRARR